ncbi:hypothetical protein Nepgr_012343 [Nepenthes gracilis]|uniref:Uncharacterized protein n=1 Tax=Nepenthes gracilis TaxID=150966 RepID=A0AAD3SH56_NEPGR|nr:hypothetical protein Nepgr_012343 [Nepenthes gracilis]
MVDQVQRVQSGVLKKNNSIAKADGRSAPSAILHTLSESRSVLCCRMPFKDGEKKEGGEKKFFGKRDEATAMGWDGSGGINGVFGR